MSLLSVLVLTALPTAEAGSSRCTVTSVGASCTYRTTTLYTGSSGTTARDVHYQLPSGAAPADGWPVVVVYQGSFMPAERTFSSSVWDLYGAYQLTRLVDELLGRGYAVVAPEAAYGGALYWQTNIPPFSTSWWTATDAYLVQDLLDGLAAGTFGAIDTNNQFATGLSSGGYMTSRMAVSYPGEFNALAIHSGSYATCAGGGLPCSVPTLPSDHPPTLFLVGAWDSIVPYYSMSPYLSRMSSQGHDYDLVYNVYAGHQWLSDAVTEIPDWFDTYLE